MNQLAQIQCPKCQAIISIEIPLPDIFNSPSVSVMTLIHPNPIACPKCMAVFTLTLGGVGQLALGLVPYVEKSKLVIPTVNGN